MDANSQSNNGNSSGAGSSNGGDGNGAGSGDQNQNQNGGGNQQQQQQQQGNQNQNSSVDLSKLEGDQLAQVLENPNLWQQPRIQELVKSNQELKKLKDEQQKAEEKRLEENNEHKTLAEQRAQQLEESNKTIQNMKIDQALTNKLVPEGIVDLEAALKLVDRSKITIDESGNITGVDDALGELKKGKAYLFGKGDGNQSLGSASNNQNGAGSGQQMKFKRSQLRDPKFYQEHKEEIRKAAAAGLIENDIS